MRIIQTLITMTWDKVNDKLSMQRKEITKWVNKQWWGGVNIGWTGYKYVNKA